ncbi:hypothetical protein Salat_0184700 [Sesamum alatum]|uniref:Uncharacterized protein n=1 Tax=Sesamum alatum TaxID=300844 RepID=A0AAE1YY99_9LAMI|nr:hypothetical protein Salat_0184700 [Sesamum alatum]
MPRAFKLLRVLDVKSTVFVRFPLDLSKLVHLRYIALSSNFKVLPEAVSKLSNTNASIILLKTPKNNEGQELQALANISPKVGGSSTFDSLGELVHLENLKLLNDVYPSPPSEGRQLPRLPPPYKFPLRLRSLTFPKRTTKTARNLKHFLSGCKCGKPPGNKPAPYHKSVVASARRIQMKRQEMERNSSPGGLKLSLFPPDE